mmetsp:Transcript_171512/g.544810  ORF Transcript_171512/g.544810 Transcript_171512/m.544810 type:complete len:266 (-) Transcript_171512:38-835(-)
MPFGRTTNSGPACTPDAGGAEQAQHIGVRILRVVPPRDLCGSAAGGVGLHRVGTLQQEVLHDLGVASLRGAVQRIRRVHEILLRTACSADEAVRLQEGRDRRLPRALLLQAQGLRPPGGLLRGGAPCGLLLLLGAPRLLPEAQLLLALHTRTRLAGLALALGLQVALGLLLLLLALQLRLELLVGALLCRLLILPPALLRDQLLLSLELMPPLQGGALRLRVQVLLGAGRGHRANRRRVEAHGVRGSVAGATGGAAAEEVHGLRR